MERSRPGEPNSRATGPFGRYRNCETKRRFESLRDAVQAADGYMNRVALTISPMVPYFCPVHSAWHIGHNRRTGHNFVIKYVGACVRRERLRQEITGLEILVNSTFYPILEAA